MVCTALGMSQICKGLVGSDRGSLAAFFFHRIINDLKYDAHLSAYRFMYLILGHLSRKYRILATREIGEHSMA